ncbi:unnamed protein product (macronuclear) [Paramecium tetraurelia]|uniref:Transmembrane protein n=1 Tax=Paramecium tetraurelia TaxID=5888 RepID=A0CEP6_PARTE|nr:uncharacterized protein GSPATT00037702001 [Paramecium tetraurelia]CAK69263.1 unnamed protein product [Paramecium tetraurelia]|eukprot:XP_001436660.1 hypothetical protein (macronuclear) [Paramecium tetraurelia strain d4-2]
MNKYTLNFKDKEIESSYQTAIQQSFRMFTFNIVTFGLLTVVVMKIVENILVEEYRFISRYCIFICYLLVQYGIGKKYKKSIRIAIILLNHMLTLIFSLQISEQEDSYNNYLKGVNVMGANFLMFISGEFMDAAISAITMSVMRIILVRIQANYMQFSTIISSVLVIFCVIRYLYHYHKAMRNQYLFTLNDSHWEKILNSIAFKQPYLVLSFIEDTLQFTLKSEAQCQKFFKKQFDGSTFIRDSVYKGNKLEAFLFTQIQKYRIDRASVFNKTLVVEYLRKMIRIECSIYYGNKPTILLLMRDFLNEQKPDTSIYELRHKNFIRLLLKILGHFDKLSSFKCRLLERKLLILQLYEDLRHSKLRESEVSVYTLARILHNLYSHLSVKAFVNGKSNLNTISNIFLLIMLILAENSKGPCLSITFTNEETSQKQLSISSNFEIEKVKRALKQISDYIQLISSCQQIEQFKISFNLNSQIYIPFQLNEMNARSLKHIDLS